MTKASLLNSAKKIPLPERHAASEFSEKRDGLASQVTDIMVKRDDIDQLTGKNNIEMMKDNHRNHARFMEFMLFEFNPEVLVDTVLWVFRAYRSHGFNLLYWPAMLDTWAGVLQNGLSEKAFKSVYPLYNWMIVNQAFFAELSDRAIESDAQKGAHLHDKKED